MVYDIYFEAVDSQLKIGIIDGLRPLEKWKGRSVSALYLRIAHKMFHSLKNSYESQHSALLGM